MGVWIEIYQSCEEAMMSVSRSLRGSVDWNNGKPYGVSEEDQVAPFVGVWIEILYDLDHYALISVAPFVGVWIEI